MFMYTKKEIILMSDYNVFKIKNLEQANKLTILNIELGLKFIQSVFFDA